VTQNFITQHEMTKIVGHQSKVKTNSRCLKYTAYFFLIAGWVTLVSNVFCAYFSDQFIPAIYWTDTETQKVHYFKIDSYGLSVLCLLKAVVGYLCIK